MNNQIIINDVDTCTTTIVEKLYRCTNPACDCHTIMRSYCFCPLCGSYIIWNRDAKLGGNVSYYTIAQLAEMVNITDGQMFDILAECSHIGGCDGVYSVWDSGEKLGGINLETTDDEYGILFPKSILNDPSVKEGLQELQEKSYDLAKASN